MKSQTQVIKKYLVENLIEPKIKGIRVVKSTIGDWITVYLGVDCNISPENYNEVYIKSLKIKKQIIEYMNSINNSIRTFEGEDGYIGNQISVQIELK